MNSNPMGLNSGVWPGNYVQPSSGNPPANPAVAGTSVGANVLNVPTPVTPYAQPGTGNPPAVTWLSGPMGTSKNGPFG
jgi:hypothetical protein